MTDKEHTLGELRKIAKDDGRYEVEALVFVLQGLEYLMNQLPEHRHVSGEELSVAARDYAHKCFGLMARVVLDQWGIHETKDFGEIVYLLIKTGWMNKTEDDQLDDFHGVYDFVEAFDKAYEIPPVKLTTHMHSNKQGKSKK